ncbi:restriction endonuclease subunit S [Aestuariibaculum sp. M13]|uniref:restriction endonuclease subunit S n=1 Tax=Aestuariibaculum sp. M13 TaxID=2967132 RepID=UPI002159D564|nr:restriction endonuclease subunit S [Aestuariibaculum sp. M13]MCR8666227.1 restriction endonuclease subunit S [Aestuariibaculum sp. M13]
MNKIKLGEILIEQKDTVKRADGRGLNLIGVSNEIGLHISRAKRITNLSKYKFIQNGWFAYNPMRINVGSIGYVYRPDQIGIVSPDYVVFSCSKKILPEYLLYILKSDEGIETINKNASGAVRKRLYFSDLSKIEIALPSIESQIRKLNVFEKIKELNIQTFGLRLKDSLFSKLKESIFREAIQGKLTKEWRSSHPELVEGPNHARELLKRIKSEKAQLVKEKKIKKEKPLPSITPEEIPFVLPEGWVWGRVSDICNVFTGNSINKTVKEAKYSKVQTGLNYIGTKDVGFNWKEIEYSTGVIIPEHETYTHFRVAPSGSVLICIEGGSSGKKIGITDREICFGNKLLATIPYIEFLAKYIYIYYNSSVFASEFQLQSKGLRGGVSTNSFKQIKVPIPPKEELLLIIKKVEALMQKCDALEQEITKSEAHANMLMQAVLKEAFQGETV